MRLLALTTASRNAARGRDSRARVTPPRGRIVVPLLAACLAAFSVQHAAEAQFPGGPFSGTYTWNNAGNWVGGTITNTTTGSFAGPTRFEFDSDYTLSSTMSVAAVGGSALTIAAPSGTNYQLTFNNNGGYGNKGNATFDQSLTLRLAAGLSGSVTFQPINQQLLTINSKVTGTGLFSANGAGDGGGVALANSANDWQGGFYIGAGASNNLRTTVANAIPYGSTVSGSGGFANALRIAQSATTGVNNPYTNGVADNVAFVRIEGNVGLTTAATFVAYSTSSHTFNGRIINNSNVQSTGLLAFVKDGSGMMTLGTNAAASNYAGNLSLRGGVLNVSSVADGAVWLNFTNAKDGFTGTTASTAGLKVGMRLYGITDNNMTGTITALTGTTFTMSQNFQFTAGGNPGRFGYANTLGISQSGSAASLLFDGGQLQYSGSAGSTNRLFSIGTGGGGIIANGTTGVLTFTGGGTIGFNGQTGDRVFTLSGTNTGTNTLTTALADNGGQTALIKSGLGRWVLGGSHAYTGTTQIEAGRLTIGAGASIGSSRTVVVGTAAGSGARLDVTDTAYTFTGSQTLMGSGTVAGGGGGATIVTINGKLSPGNGPGLLTFDDTSVALGSTGNVIMEITGSGRGTQYDAIDITDGLNGGGLTYGGTMTLNFDQTFSSGTFNLFKYELNETSGTFGGIVFDPASQYQGAWALVGDVWQVTSGTTVMEFRNNVVEGGFSYGQLVIVPEPLTLGLLGIGSGIAVVGLRRLRRRKANGANGTHTSEDTADAA